MSCKSVITIGRQYGSGGRQIGQELASALGVKCYDKELLDHAASESGISKQLFESNDEHSTSSLLYSLVMDSHSFGYSSAITDDLPINHKLFLAQFDAIKKLADEGPCIMVGRCADYALADRDNCLNIFIYADMNIRIKRIMRRFNISEARAKDSIRKTDKSRASYYNYYTDKRWGESESYHLCINSSTYGIEGTVKLILNALEIAEQTREG